MSTNVKDEFPLTSLLPSSSYLLAYSIPLLLLSVVLTFAGTFLILDRTRSFVPNYYALPGTFKHAKKVSFSLEGGVGGLAVGYAFGVHLSTFLSLLIPAVSTSRPLNSQTFLAVWLLSAVVTTPLGGRWKYVALSFAGLTGGTLFAVSLSVIIHPSLLTRIVLTAVIVSILTVMTLLPLDRFQHSALRFATSSTGAAGLVVSIALLARIPPWANVWERYWVQDGLDWGTSQEKGLSAAFCLLLATGIVFDWFLKRTFGECPDGKWDSYLASYTSNLPDRSGTFEPFEPFWKRLLQFKANGRSSDIIFPPNDHDIKLPPYPSSPTKSLNDDDESTFHRKPAFLMKGRTKKGGHARFHARRPKRNREGVKFRPLADDDLTSGSDSDDGNDWKSPNRPWLKQRPSLSSTTTTPTLVGDDKEDNTSTRDKNTLDVDYEREIPKLGNLKSEHVSAGLGEGEVPDYSDYEEDVTSLKRHLHENRHKRKEMEWSPGFMKKQQWGQTQESSSSRSQVTTDASSATPPLFGSVPATPSLIKALDRIVVAQKDAFSHTRSEMPSTSVPEGEGKEAAKWDAFWKDVKNRSVPDKETNS